MYNELSYIGKSGLKVSEVGSGTAPVGITANRPLTSGFFKDLMRTVYPKINDVLDINELFLNCILSGSRGATAIVGMRGTREVEANHRVSYGREASQPGEDS